MRADLNSIIEAIQHLKPDQRRQLQRRLRASGLLTSDELITDRNRLQIVTTPKSHTASASQYVNTEQMETTEDVDDLEKFPEALSIPVEYESPVSGRVVLGTPESKQEETEENPHAMLPLPGLAPQTPIELIFDGGSRGNPGQGYGSYLLRWPGQAEQVVRLHFGNRVTNNEAEYDTLIAALEAVLQRLVDQGSDPKTGRLQAYGDSMLVINQVQGAWRCNNPRMKLRCERAQELIQQFGKWELIHHKREKSVEALGH